MSIPVVRREDLGPEDTSFGDDNPLLRAGQRPCACVTCNDACMAEGDAKVCTECADAPGDMYADCHGTPDENESDVLRRAALSNGQP